MNYTNGINHIHASLRIGFALFRPMPCGPRITFPIDNHNIYQKRFILVRIARLCGVQKTN